MLRLNVKEGGETAQRSESQTETSCAPAFWIESIHEVEVGARSPFIWGPFMLPSLQPVPIMYLDFDPKKLCESSVGCKNKAEPKSSALK